MYTEKQLKEIAKGVFKGSPGILVLYGNPNGTFNNESQFAKKSKAEQEGWIKITREAKNEDAPADDEAAKLKAEAAKAPEKAAKAPEKK